MKSYKQYLNESLVNTDRTSTLDPIQMLRGALADEASASNLYDTMIKYLSNYNVGAACSNLEESDLYECIDVLKEITRDEKNHQGRILYLLKKFDPDFEKTEAGLRNQE